MGIVNAVEIVNAFEGLEGLRQFRDWVSNPDPQLLAAIGGTAADAGASLIWCNGHFVAVATRTPPKLNQGNHIGDSEAVAQFKRKHKGARRNWDLPESFPSTTIINAYFQANSTMSISLHPAASYVIHLSVHQSIEIHMNTSIMGQASG